jgi:hypothetical protein
MKCINSLEINETEDKTLKLIVFKIFKAIGPFRYIKILLSIRGCEAETTITLKKDMFLCCLASRLHHPRIEAEHLIYLN